MDTLAFLEAAVDDWWDKLTKEEQQAYIQAHPSSCFAKTPRTLYRAGGDQNRFGGSEGPTFYSIRPEGTKPFEDADNPTKTYNLYLKKTFHGDNNIEDWRTYNRFLQETGHPGRRGKNGYPYWTTEPDLHAWLDKQGIDHDSIQFDEPTGYPSIAVYHSRLAEKASLLEAAADEWWNRLNREEQEVYLMAYSYSHFLTEAVDDEQLIKRFARRQKVGVDLNTKPETWKLNRIQRNPDAPYGNGGKVMKAINKVADRKKKRVELIPLERDKFKHNLSDYYHKFGYRHTDPDKLYKMTREPEESNS